MAIALGAAFVLALPFAGLMLLFAISDNLAHAEPWTPARSVVKLRDRSDSATNPSSRAA
jgi:hypothetical protein